MDGQAKGGGAISAVAATGSNILFIGTGEHMHDLEPFVPRSFIGKMLGMGDMARLFETVKDSMGGKEGGGLMKSLEKGKFTLGDMREQFATIRGMGPMSKVLGMMPGVPAEMLGGMNDADGAKKIKTYLCIIDSMTEAEVLSDGKMFYKEPSRTCIFIIR
jgi:signal recognition particle subunit SRP54